jgi:hypothetical protein
MKLTRRQLRKLISEAIKPGSKYDMYKKYNVTGDELDMIKSLRTHEEPEFREQGLEIGRSMGIPLVDNETIQVIGYQDNQMRGTDQYEYHNIIIPPDIVRDILKNWRKVIDEKVIGNDRGFWEYTGDEYRYDDVFSQWKQAMWRYFLYVDDILEAEGLDKFSWHYDVFKGNHGDTLEQSAHAMSEFI